MQATLPVVSCATVYPLLFASNKQSHTQFINEHAPNQMRGFLIVAYSLWFTLGGLVASIVLKTHNTTSPNDWRLPILTQFAVIGLSFLIFLVLPESPWWLLSKGKVQKAEAIMIKKFGNVEGFDIPAEMAIMQATIDQQREWDAQARLEGPLAIFKGLNGKRFLIGCVSGLTRPISFCWF